MDALQALMSRRTGHDWLPEPLPEGVLDKALAAANQAPCHKYTWPWRFVVVGPQTRPALADILLATKQRKRELSPAMQEKARRKVLDPGAVVVACQVRSDDAFQSKEDYAAVACAIQNMLIVATAEGLASKWSTGGFTRESATYGLLGLDPDELEIVGCVFLGRPQGLPPIKRPPVEQVVRRLP